MKTIILYLALAAMMLTACTDRKPVKREAEKIDTIPVW